MADDIRFSVTVTSTSGEKALRSLEQRIKSLQKTANSASQSLRNLTVGTTGGKGLGFTKFAADARVVERGIGRIRHQLDTLRRAALANREVFRSLSGIEDPNNERSRIFTRSIAASERAAARVPRQESRFDFLEIAGAERQAIKRNNIERLKGALDAKKTFDQISASERNAARNRNVMSTIAQRDARQQFEAIAASERSAAKLKNFQATKTQQRRKEFLDEISAAQQVVKQEEIGRKARERSQKRVRAIAERQLRDETTAARKRNQEELAHARNRAKIIHNLMKPDEPASSRKHGGRRFGFGAGANRFQNMSMVAGGALTGLTGNMGFLGVGFAAMSGGPMGAAVVGFATSIGAIIRTASAFEASLANLKGDMDKLSPGMAKQVNAYTKSVEQLERGILLAGLGGRTGTSTRQQVSGGVRLFGGMVSQEAVNTHLMNPLNLFSGIFIAFRQLGQEAERTARLEEKLTFELKEQNPIIQRYQEEQEKLRKEMIEVQEETNKQVKLQNEINRISRIVSFGELDMHTGAKFLAKQELGILDKEFNARIVSSEDLARRIQEGAASRRMEDEPRRSDIERMTERIVAAINGTGDRERGELQKIENILGKDNITSGRIPRATLINAP